MIYEVESGDIIIYSGVKYVCEGGIISQDENALVLTAGNIIRTILRYYDVSFEDVASKSRIRNIVRARQCCAHFLYKCTNMSLSKIAEMFKCNHSSISYHRKKFMDDTRFDKRCKAEYEYFAKVFSDGIMVNSR